VGDSSTVCPLIEKVHKNTKLTTNIFTGRKLILENNSY
jgi:hypothetical protein